MTLKWSTLLYLIFVGFLVIQNVIPVEASVGDPDDGVGDIAAGGTGGRGGLECGGNDEAWSGGQGGNGGGCDGNCLGQ